MLSAPARAARASIDGRASHQSSAVHGAADSCAAVFKFESFTFYFI